MANIFIFLSIVLPIVFGFIIWFRQCDKVSGLLTYSLLPILTFMGFYVYSVDASIYIHTIGLLDFFIVTFDFFLLIYFAWIGMQRKSNLVIFLAIVQFILLIMVISIAPEVNTANIYVDKLSAMIYLLVALVGVPIAIYSLKYMDYNEKRKHTFIAIVVGFLGVMNFIVSVNNIEWFFTLFELTTLASVVMIGYRGDKESINNSTLALWMNQIGGVAILFSLLIMIKDFGVYHFTDLWQLDKTTITMAAFGFLSIAALVKGAQLPFHKWLLGAMVAPTPVSAILHSATMVKIAPFLLLRLSPVIQDTLLSKLLVLTTGFVFVAAAVFALTQNNFKKILAYSTISLLGLMMLAASIGSSMAVTISIILIIFHGIAKGFLFVEAGILEKLFKVKYIEDMNRLLEKAPLTLLFIIFGFLNMTFVPFGSFIGKWLMIEEASNFLSKGSSVLLIALVAIGGVFLSVLYMKVIGVAIKHHRFSKIKVYPQPKNFLFVSVWYYAILSILTIFIAPFIANFVSPIAIFITGKANGLYADGLSLVLGNSTLEFWQIIGAMILLIAIHVAPFIFKFKNVEQVHPYNCGEITKRDAQSYDFNFINNYESKINMIAITLFISVLIFGGNLL